MARRRRGGPPCRAEPQSVPTGARPARAPRPGRRRGRGVRARTVEHAHAGVRRVRPVVGGRDQRRTARGGPRVQRGERRRSAAARSDGADRGRGRCRPGLHHRADLCCGGDRSQELPAREDRATRFARARARERSRRPWQHQCMARRGPAGPQWRSRSPCPAERRSASGRAAARGRRPLIGGSQSHAASGAGNGGKVGQEETDPVQNRPRVADLSGVKGGQDQTLSDPAAPETPAQRVVKGSSKPRRLTRARDPNP